MTDLRTTPTTQEQRVILIRILVVFFLSAWIIRWWNHLLFGQVQGTPFVHVQADNTYWIFHLLNIPQFFLSSPVWASLFDVIYLLLLFLIYDQPNKRVYTYSFLILQVIYFVGFHSAMTHHAHQASALPFFAFLICFRKEENFILVFRALRYYACYVFCSAALWKVSRGSAFLPEQMEAILRVQHIDYLTNSTVSIYHDFLYFWMNRTWETTVLWYAAISVQLSFIIGFLTIRLDRFLFVGIVLFLFMDYWLMNLNFWEFSLWAICFLPWYGFKTRMTMIPKSIQ